MLLRLFLNTRPRWKLGFRRLYTDFQLLASFLTIFSQINRAVWSYQRRFVGGFDKHIINVQRYGLFLKCATKIEIFYHFFSKSAPFWANFWRFWVPFRKRDGSKRKTLSYFSSVCFFLTYAHHCELISCFVIRCQDPVVFLHPSPYGYTGKVCHILNLGLG